MSQILYVLAWIVYAPVFGLTEAINDIQEYHTYRGKTYGLAVLALVRFYFWAIVAVPSLILICVFGLNIAEHTQVRQ